MGPDPITKSTCSNPHKLGCAVVQGATIHLLKTSNQAGEQRNL